MKKTYETFSPEETYELAFEMGKKAAGGDIYCLDGELGAGKTCFAKGFARGMGICENITSPTFTIINEYEGDPALYHFDAYRLGDEEGLYAIGADEYFYKNGVCIIEWSDIIKTALPENAIKIRLFKDGIKGDGYRRIEVEQ